MKITFKWGMSGIYAIVNAINGRIYIGSASDLGHRWSSHISLLKLDKHPNRYLQSSYKKYGEASFDFKIVEVIDKKEKLLEREQYWIDKLGCLVPNGFNICPKAGSTTGVIPSIETIEKIRNKALGRKYSEDTKIKMSKSLIGNTRWLGKKHREESKDKCRVAKIGNKYSVGINNGSAKLKESDIMEIRKRIFSGSERQLDIANYYGVKQVTISAIKTGKIWSHVL